MAVGGDFIYPPPSPEPHNLMLVAGGVGINPLLSILRYLAGIRETDKSELKVPQEVHLLYSAKTCDELLYKVSSYYVYNILSSWRRKGTYVTLRSSRYTLSTHNW